MQPGRSCPLHYRYSASALARAADFSAETLYVIGGLYGNVPALDAVLELAAHEPGGATLVFNGDFNWFNIDAAGFAAINNEVLQHTALRGNVETELANDDDAAGCGCAYPAWVGNAEVEHSNRIFSCLRETAQTHPELRARLAALPMHRVAEVGGLRVAIVHGDAESLAGWGYAQEALADTAHCDSIAAQFDSAQVRIIASSHTCLPVLAGFNARNGHSLLINNGATGMPNFAQTRYGVISRISIRPATHLQTLYGTRVAGVHVDALPVHYDHARWISMFETNWPQGSPAHASYHQRILSGPHYQLTQVLRGAINPGASSLVTAIPMEKV